jgi:hypothetical protein
MTGCLEVPPDFEWPQTGGYDESWERFQRLQDEVKETLRKGLTTMSQKCKAVFGFSTTAGMQNGLQFANSMTFHDGRLPGLMSLAGGHGGYSDMTFAQYHQGSLSAAATTLLDSSNRPSRHVVLWHDFFGGQLPMPIANQRITLVHEFAHSYFRLGRLDHSDLTQRLGTTVRPGQSHTSALDQWLEDCWK